MKKKPFSIKLNWLLTTYLSFFIAVTGSAQINCTFVENYGNAKKASVLEQVNNEVAGAVYDVGATNLKKLKIKRAKNIFFDGCKVTVELEVELERKVRRDAEGTIFVSGTVYEAKLYGDKHIKIKNASVDKVRLGRTLRIGEAFYKWVADRTFPSKQTFRI